NGVSIEHGHENLIDENTFEKCGVAVNLWADPNPDFEKKPYGKNRDTKSHGYKIVRNERREIARPDRIENTTHVETNEDNVPSLALELPPVQDGQRAFLPKGAPFGKQWIFVDEWGPCDFSTVRIFPSELTAWGEGQLLAIGPGAHFEVTSEGVAV